MLAGLPEVPKNSVPSSSYKSGLHSMKYSLIYVHIKPTCVLESRYRNVFGSPEITDAFPWRRLLLAIGLPLDRRNILRSNTPFWP
jgi:hypothetical protein